MCCEAANHSLGTHLQCFRNLSQLLLCQLSPLPHSYCEIHPAMSKCFHVRRRGSIRQPQATATLCYLYENGVCAFNCTAICVLICAHVILLISFDPLGLLCVKTSRQMWRMASCSSSTFWLLSCKVTYLLIVQRKTLNYASHVLCQISLKCQWRDLLSCAFFISVC